LASLTANALAVLDLRNTHHLGLPRLLIVILGHYNLVLGRSGISGGRAAASNRSEESRRKEIPAPAAPVDDLSRMGDFEWRPLALLTMFRFLAHAGRPGTLGKMRSALCSYVSALILSHVSSLGRLVAILGFPVAACLGRVLGRRTGDGTVQCRYGIASGARRS
jgi:hypothetical protein